MAGFGPAARLGVAKMHILETAKAAGSYVAEKTEAGAWRLNGAARHVNLYRGAEYFLSKHTQLGSTYHDRAEFWNNLLGDFDTHDQDKSRPDWARKLQLCKINQNKADVLRSLLVAAKKKNINNLSVLHQMRRTHDIVIGERANSAESLAYIRRASRKIHPDKTADLAGWERPGVKYFKSLGSDYKYEHARQGAHALFRLHRAFVPILTNPHYQRLLWSTPVKKGGVLTVGDLSKDLTAFTAIGVAYCLIKKRSMQALLWTSGSCYALLLAVHLAQLLLAYRASKKEVKCREVVLYKSPQGV